MICTDEQGKRWETKGYNQWLKGHWYLNCYGMPELATEDTDPGGGKYYSEIAPVRVEHTFGGIVFAETGELRQAEEGEWLLDRTCFPHYAGFPACGPSITLQRIIRPVRVVPTQK